MTALAAAAAALAVNAGFDAKAPMFGAAFRSNVVVTLDTTRWRADSVRVVDDLSPLTPLTAAHTTRTTRGDMLTIRIERTVACLTEECVAGNGVARPKLGRVVVTVTSVEGNSLRIAGRRGPLAIRGRVTRADLSRARPPFHADTTTPPPSYRIAPSTLAGLLYAAGSVLALAAAAVVLRSLVFRKRREVAVDPLARALRLAREAERRDMPDRRRALGLLAQLLGRSPLGERTSGLAWARPGPEPEEIEGVVDDVEREVRA